MSLRGAVTMRDVAKAADVHVTTVSLALRNSPRITASTRARVRDLAAAMGYRPNPLVAALVGSRRSARPRVFQGSLAFVTWFSPRTIGTKPGYTEACRRGALQRARELGFQLDVFELADFQNDPARLQSVLRARNIHGLLIAPLLAEAGVLDLDWDSLAGVAIGPNLLQPPLDHVDTDRFRGIRLALTECERRGYCRPAFLSFPVNDRRTQGDARGGFLTYPAKARQFRLLPPLVLNMQDISTKLPAWWRRYKPDVLLAKDSVILKCLPVLKKCGFHSPPDFGVVQLNVGGPALPYSGIPASSELIGALAVDFLVGKLYRNEFGVPKVAQTILAAPQWHEGRSLPVRG